MSIQFACPYCDKVSSVPDSFAGKKGKCPSCKKVIEVPDPNADDDGGDGGGGDSGAGDYDSGGGGGGANTKECRYCGETIKKVAKKCKYCGEFLDKRLKPGRGRGGGAAARAKARKAEEMPSAAEYVLCVLCSCIGGIVAIVYLLQGYTKKGGIMLVLSIVCWFLGFFLQVIMQGSQGY